MALAARIAFLLLPLAGLPGAGEVHVDRGRGFRIEVPEGWSAQESESADVFTLALTPPASAGRAGVTVRVFPLAQGAGAEAALERARSTIAAGEGYSEYEEFETELAGRPALGLRVRLRAPSGDYRIEQLYLAAGGRAYQLQRHAPAGEFGRRSPELAAVAASFALVPVDEAAQEAARLRALAARCGSEVHWAADWKEAGERARRERKPVLVVAYLLSGFDLGSTPRASLFMDEDVIALVNARYVPFWYTRGSAPALEERYGLSRTAFGQALLLATPEGEVFLETQETRRPSLAHAFLRAGLERRAELTGPPLPAGLTPLERARLRIDRGELDLALELLAERTSAAALRLRARALGLERRGEEALAALAAARKADAESGGALADALRVDEAEILVRLGRDDQARAELEPVLAARRPGEPPGDAVTRALSLLALVDLAAGDLAAARARWRAIVEETPDHRLAWSSAAALGNDLVELGVSPDLAWPEEERFAELLAFPTPAPRPRSRAAVAEREALAWLLAAQRPDGSWLSPREHGRIEELGPDPILDATTALAARALLPHADDEAVRAALDRALAFLLASVALRETSPPRVFFMDYVTWSDGCLLSFLAAAVEAGRLPRERALPAVDSLVADLALRRVAGGGWSYYVTRDLSARNAPAQSISFTTANAVLGLARARAAGFDVPDELLEAGVTALEAMRSEEGVFSYFLYPGRRRAASTPAAGAVGRGPVCELALLRAGAGKARDLRRSLRLFFTHDRLFAAEQGKVLMHAGPDAQGCHYLFFDYAHAAEAHAELGARDGKTRARLLELVLACRQPDGSFLDTPLLGRAYGTAMALLAFDALS